MTIECAACVKSVDTYPLTIDQTSSFECSQATGDLTTECAPCVQSGHSTYKVYLQITELLLAPYEFITIQNGCADRNTYSYISYLIHREDESASYAVHRMTPTTYDLVKQLDPNTIHEEIWHFNTDQSVCCRV